MKIIAIRCLATIALGLLFVVGGGAFARPAAATDLREYVLDTATPLLDAVGDAAGQLCNIGEMCPSVCAGVGSESTFTMRFCPDAAD